MKKKIAIFANGLSPETLISMIKGIRNCYEFDQPDIFIFLSHARKNHAQTEIDGENSIYDLPDVSVYDGVIVCANNITDPEISMEICLRTEKCGVPLVTLGIGYKDYPVITIDNVTGMIQLVDHLIEKHNVKRAVFICGEKVQVDSNERLKIVKKEFGRHGLQFRDEDVYFGDWEYEGVAECIDKIVKSKDGLPDAIFCANDNMALIAVTELSVKGIKVPKDVIVTGFDGIEEAKQFYPAITSVKQNFEEVGEACVKALFGSSHIRSKHIQLLSSIDIAESCGCDKYNEFEQLRNIFCQESYGKTMRNDLMTTEEKKLENEIVNTENIQQLKEVLSEKYLNNHIFVGNDFYIIIDPKLYSKKTEHYSSILQKDFSNKMTPVLAMKGGKLLENTHVDRQSVVPAYNNEDLNHTYFIMPLHMEDYVIGYTILVDMPHCVKDRHVYNYLSSLNHSFRQLKDAMMLSSLNKNLTELYHKDSMTGLYNRFGFEDIAKPLFEKNTADKKRTMVCFLDINYMKQINDKYGHAQGDNAIITVGEAIRANERKNWIAIRYGGDEFLLVAQCADENDANSIKKNILDEINYAVELKKLPYRLGVSCGFVVSDPGSGKTLQEYIKEADEVMYEIKKEVHTKGMDRRRR